MTIGLVGVAVAITGAGIALDRILVAGILKNLDAEAARRGRASRHPGEHRRLARSAAGRRRPGHPGGGLPGPRPCRVGRRRSAHPCRSRRSACRRRGRTGGQRGRRSGRRSRDVEGGRSNRRAGRRAPMGALGCVRHGRAAVQSGAAYGTPDRRSGAADGARGDRLVRHRAGVATCRRTARRSGAGVRDGGGRSSPGSPRRR